MKECPSVEALQSLLADPPVGPEVEQVTAHVEDCASCQARLERLTSSANRALLVEESAAGFLEQLRRTPPPDGDTPPEGLRPAPSPVGTSWPSVPGYEIQHVLARGGMGVVYLARQTSLGRLVALKVILDGPHAGPEKVARFHREAEAIARLRHPHVVQIHDSGVCDGRPFFAMEYVAGGSLARHLDGTPFNPLRAVNLVQTLARAVDTAHRLGIIHRDLKPANVLLTEDGTPKISDFGLAKITARVEWAGESQRHSLATQSGDIMGTPSYIPPEQAQGKVAAIGPTADVYALGAILYELLTGRPPFRGETPFDTVLQVVHHDPVAPGRLVPNLARDLEVICLKCLHKEPRQRYANALALAEDLERFATGKPIQARPPSPWDRTWKWVRRRPAQAALVLVIVAAATGLGLGVYVYQAHLQAARRLAEDNFSEALKIVDRAHYLLEYADLPKTAELAQLRQGLEPDEEQAFQRLLERNTGVDPGVRDLRGLAHRVLGDFKKSRGQYDLAEDHYRQSVASLEPVVKDFPDQLEWRQHLAYTYLRLGQLFAHRDRKDLAEEWFRKAQSLFETLVKADARNYGYQSCLVICYHSRGLRSYQTGHPAEAEAAFQKALDLWEKLDPPTAERFGHDRQRAILCQDLGVMLRGHQPDRAVELLEKARTLAEVQVQRFPGERAKQSYLGVVLNQLAIAHEAAGSREKAEKTFQQAVVLGERLVKESPDDLAETYNLVAVWTMLGLFYAKSAQHRDEAARASQNALRLQESLVRAQPDNWQFAFRQAQVFNNLGRLAIAEGRIEAKLDWYTRAANTLEPLVRKRPDEAEIRDNLIGSLKMRGDALSQLRRFDEANLVLDRLRDYDPAHADEYRAKHALNLLYRGDHANAAAEAERLAEKPDLAGDALYDTACIFALLIPAVRQNPELTPQEHNRRAEQAGVRAVQLLTRLKATGYFTRLDRRDHLKNGDRDLDSLRPRAEFQKLLADVDREAPANTP